MLSRRFLLAGSLAVLASPTVAIALAPPDGTFIAVLDHFEAASDGRLAVLVLEEAGEARGRLVVPEPDVPESARHQDAVMEVVVRAGELSSARYLTEETRRRAEEAQAQFDRLAHGTCDDE